MRRITVLDTTLRDGTQSPGFDMTRGDRLTIAAYLEKLGVDIIESGFPASSPAQFDEVMAVAESLKTSAVSALARATVDDIKTAGRAIRGAAKRCIHTSISTSPVHRRFKLKKSRGAILDMAVDAVLCATEYADLVEIGAEDATRTEPEFLEEFCVMVTDAGAAVVNIADTVGCMQPDEYRLLISRLYGNVKAFQDGRARLSVHCHNDMGLATSNTIAGLCAGASQAEVTLLGLGERAGNAPLEELVMALAARSDYFHGMHTGINPAFFAETARELAAITGCPFSPHKPVAGRNTYSHTSGIHQHGILADISSYSLGISPRFGYRPATITVNRHSGKQGLRARLIELAGNTSAQYDEDMLLERFKTFADLKQDITSTDIISFFNSQGLLDSRVWHIASYSLSAEGDDAGDSIRIRMEFVSNDGMSKKYSASGMNRWDVLFSLLGRAFGIDIELIEYSFTGAGTSARVKERAYILARYRGIDYSEEASGNDGMKLMAECYLAIINRITALLHVNSRESGDRCLHQYA